MELQDIPLEQLSRTKINARTHGATEPWDTLAASIRAQGVLQPLRVQPMAGGDRFEIIGGGALRSHPTPGYRRAAGSGGLDRRGDARVVRADRTPPHNAAIEASVRARPAHGRLADERATVGRGRAGEADPAPSTAEAEPPDATLTGHGGGERRTAEGFGRLLELSDAPGLKVLAVIAAEALVAGSGLAERLGERLQIDLRAFWQPDETFRALRTDKAALGRGAAAVGAAPASQATGKE